MELSLLILVCIHESCIVYLEIYVMPIGRGFSFLVVEKSWKINVEKEGAPWFTAYLVMFVNVCKRGREVWPNVDKSRQGEGINFLLHFLWTSFVDDSRT